MFYIQRENYPDRFLNPASLQAVAEMWVGWYRIWRRRRALGWLGAAGEYRLAVELYGVPRHEIPAVSQALLERVTPGLPGCSLVLFDPDTVRIVGPVRPAEEPPEISLWLSLMVAEEAHGTVARLRVELDTGRGFLAAGAGQYDLVLTGTPRGRGMVLKAAWPEGPVADWPRLYRHARWPDEEAFLRALDFFLSVQNDRLAGVPPPFGADWPGVGPGGWLGNRAADAAASASFVQFGAAGAVVFGSRTAHWIGGGAVSLLLGRFQETPAAFAGRVALALVPAAALLAASSTGRGGGGAGAGMLAAAAIAALLPLWVVAQKVKLLWTFKRRMGAVMSRTLLEPATYTDVSMVDAGLADDVNVRKMAAELEHAGLRRARDFRLELEGHVSFARLYVAPDVPAEVSVGLFGPGGQFVAFPAHVVLLTSTDFADSSSLRCMNAAAGTAYRKNRSGLPQVVRYLPDAGPAELLALHRKQLAPLVAGGKVPLPPRPERAFEAMEEERQRRAAAMRGKTLYTWGDALHETFGVIRREYRVE